MDFQADLNPEQLAAVTHGTGPQLVLAGAGSGKTRVITYRMAWLVHECGVDPRSVVAVTFTNKAAQEMRERVEQLLGMTPLPSFVGTFHKFSLLMLRRWGEHVGLKRDFTIFDSTDQKTLIKRALKKEELSESAFPPRVMQSTISAAKNQLVDASAYESRAKGFFEQRVARVYKAYQGMLREAGGVDFDDMIALAVRILRTQPGIRDAVRSRLDYLMVDEFQDTNHAQMSLVLELVGGEGNITAVGDEDQGIYRWRGADLDNVLSFERSFPGAEVRLLERNYRSTQNILTAAGELVAKNHGRRGKRLWTDAGDGELIELYRARDEQDEARWLVSTLKGLQKRHPLSDMGVLVRTNAQTRAIEDEFLRREVPYVLVGGTRFYERAEIKDLVAYLRVLRNPRDDLSLRRILNTPPRGIGKVTEDNLLHVAGEEGMPVWDVIFNDELGSFPARSAGALREFRKLITGLQAEAGERSLASLLEETLERSGYTSMFDPEDPDGASRLENVEEFVSAAQEFSERRGEEAGEEADELTAFLDHVALVADLDGWQAQRGVSLMTLHSAKGLEFPVVTVCGLEEGVLPHFNAGEERDAVEEERRLLYVGMTRARQKLFLTTCSRRRIAGRYQDQEDSRFIAEIPAEALEVSRSPELFQERARGVRSFFGGSDKQPRWAGAAPRTSANSSPSRPAPTRATSKGLPPSEEGLGKGARVRHATLGKGVVLDVEGSGPSRKLVVFFDKGGKRKLVARYAGLERA